MMVVDLDAWPGELHDECTARRIAEGHQPAYAAVRGAIDVMLLARVTYPAFTLETALARLCHDQITQTAQSTDREHVAVGEATVVSLDDHRAHRAAEA